MPSESTKDMTPSDDSSLYSIAIAIAAATTAAFITSTISARQRKENEARIAKLDENRQAERTGRIRAEMKLRTHLKNQDANNNLTEAESTRGGEESADTNTPQQKQNGLFLHCIGTIVSPYTKRMGTPRQGALVPTSRGYIQLKIPVECVEGLELYSHAWVVFTFHANTNARGPIKSSSGNNGMLNLTKTKIRPPRGNGIKVGMLATRSPHRPNNIGLSLVKIVRVDKKLKQLHIAGLDLVNGTPVYDVKPCVPWDIPNVSKIESPSLLNPLLYIELPSQSPLLYLIFFSQLPLEVPTWVSQDDELESVKFSPKAEESLEVCLQNGKLAPLYTVDNNGFEGATQSICEILAQDPRASNSNGPNKRGSSSSLTSSSTAYSHKNDTYKMLFCSVEVLFRVGGEGVIVENVTAMDLKGVQHVDGIPILLENGRGKIDMRHSESILDM